MASDTPEKAGMKVPLPPIDSFTKTWHSRPYPFISPTRQELSAAGKNVVVTGGGTGIGKAIAIAFAQAGAVTVSIIGRRLNRLESAAKHIQTAGPGTKVLYKSADMVDRDAAEEALESIVSEVGKIHVFVSNASILPQPGPIVGYDLKHWRECFEVNVVGPFNAIQAFVPRAAAGAHLFNISSGQSHMAPMQYFLAANYACTKAMVAKMFDFVTFENPDLHVVNIQPGTINTELGGGSELIAPDVAELPAHFSVWLASPEADFLKGKYVWANWDAEELLSRREEIVKDPFLLKVVLKGVDM